MKKKVIALTLSAVLALSSTSALAAESCTKKFDINSLSKFCSGDKSQCNVTVNKKNIDLNSIDWSSLLNKKFNFIKEEGTTPAEAEEPADNQEPAESQEPTEVQTPAESQEPAEVQTPAETQEPADTTETTANPSNSSYEKKVVELVNVERQKAGLSALTLDSAISNVARMKSQDMADNNYFAHQSPTYGSAGDMMRKFGINWSAWGENIASGQRTPEEVVNAWMNSSGHRANILSSNFSKIGVGYATNSNGTPYWTQMFTN